MSESPFEIEIHDIRIAGIPDRHVVAKVGRISSPPIAIDAVQDPRAAAIARLADVLRGGAQTRAHADYVAFKSSQREPPHTEWDGYVAVVCRALGTERLDPLDLTPLPVAGSDGGLKVAYHEAEMNDKPYVVARIGPVIGGPAAVLLLNDPAHSALERLADAVRTGTTGRCFADLLAGRAVADVASDWQQYGRAVAEALSASNGAGPSKEEWIKDCEVHVGGLYRFSPTSAAAVVLGGGGLVAGDVVRVLDRPHWSPSGLLCVRIGDRETGVEIGLVRVMSLRPL